MTNSPDIGSRDSDGGVVWHEVFWPRPLTEDVAARVVRAWATDGRSPIVILEAQASSAGIRYLLGSVATDIGVVKEVVIGLCPGVLLVPLSGARPGVLIAGRLKLNTRHRPLTTDDLSASSRSVMAALSCPWP